MGRRVVPCCGPPYHVVVAPPIALHHKSAPHCVVVIPRWSPSPCHHRYIPASLRAVACSGGVWCHGCHHLPLVPVIILFCISGAGADAGARIIIVVLPSLSSPFLLSVVMEMGTGQLTPIPPCKQELAVVGGGCWAVVSSLSSLSTGCSSQAAPTIHSTSSFS